MKKLVPAIIVIFVLMTLACLSGDPTETPTPTPAPATNTPVAQADTPVPPTATPTAAPAGPGPARTLQDVQKAAIQIEAQGTFTEPSGEQTATAGRGSGFIIDPSGIAVTNNHVVAGAGLLKVWIGGDTTRTYNAVVLGVSECSDLAVIDIEGEGYDYLEWYQGDIHPGLDVYAVGFPLGEPQYTLTRGIVSKAQAGGETSWASVDAVIEHDATINPGNSGGPLVTGDGQVVGVNYRGRPNSNQYFAIARPEAVPIIERLSAGQDVESIGVNGEVVILETGESGIWVASVEAGSAADRAGIQGGDIIFRLAELPLATDGTMSDYCDILRSHNLETDAINVEIVRFATEEVWEGQLNGRTLERSFSFAQEGAGDVEPGGGETGPGYENYVRINDDLGAITVEVPVEWADVDTSPWVNDSGVTLSARIRAAPSLGNLLDDGSGVIFLAANLDDAFNADEWLDQLDFTDSCVSYQGRNDYQDPLYAGKYDYYTGCGNDSIIFVVVAAPEDESFVTIVLVQAVTSADLDAADRVFDTFTVVGELPGGDGGSPGGGGGGQGGGASLTIVNQANEDIYFFNVSPSTSDSWGEDWLGDVIIAPGQSHTLSGIAPGTYDLRPLDAEQETMGTLYHVPLSDEHTLTVTGLATLPANAELTFQDDFTDNRNNWGRAGEGPNITYYPPNNGEFCMLIKSEYRIGWEWYEPFRPSEFFAQVLCSLEDPDMECGLGFGPDGDNLYWFQVHPEQQRFGLDLLQNDEWQEALIEWTTSYYVNPSGNNYLALGRVGNLVSVYVNGNLVGQVRNDLFPTGRIGIGGGTYDSSNLLICLDNLKVWRLN